MVSITTYERELLQVTKGLAPDKIEEVIDFVNYLKIKDKIRKSNFSQKIDSLWKRMRAAAEKSGYGIKDVERIIAEVRARKKTI